ncbi:class I SAM-dependent methyltransferase [Lapidilactobacillus luobeiensis]|uniref:class I SAM-dependent methyltransferase n=1 Tax=Lapidilactobacillus luobeiensis TaxID=2950371 RepID=UPI0021C409B3|nr:class I SAM-dependent methyltransferase [Lapidilactobacillus luobeiensis]
MFKEYGPLSTQVYQITKPIGRSLNGDLDYYAQQLAKQPGRILEAGVGTGRMLIPLLQKGLQVDGLDLSAEMLAQCRENLAANGLTADLFQQDLTHLQLDRTYQAIIMPTGSFDLLPKEQILTVLQGFYQHLAPDGFLLFDTILPSDFKPGEVTVDSFPLDDQRGILFTSTSEQFDWPAQKVSYSHRYELVDQGQVVQTELSHFVLYWYGAMEMRLLLEKAGFTTISQQTGYGQDTTSDLLTFRAQRA